jgi:peptidoglycan/LPS O-acetylase OafA/YrhL
VTTAPRNSSLDGLRGIAIALVVLFHSYSRWASVAPFGDRFAHTPVLSQGNIGVYLFFLISGYVIFMTLDRSAGFLDFMKRRFLRLWPAMLAVTVLLFVTAPLFNRPIGPPSLRDLLPGLTFIEQSGWAWILGSPQGILEYSFWTLFIEVKFYIVVSALYFAIGWRWAIVTLIAAYFAPMVVGRIPVIPPAVYWLSSFLDSWFWAWFAAGALYYKAQATRWLLLPAFALSLFAAVRMQPGMVGPGIVVVMLFAVAQLSSHVRAFLSLRPFVFIGAISYPLYLVHENMVVSLVGQVGRAAPWLPAVLVPVLPICIVVLIAWVLATYVEPAVRDAIRMRWRTASAPVTPGA